VLQQGLVIQTTVLLQQDSTMMIQWPMWYTSVSV